MTDSKLDSFMEAFRDGAGFSDYGEFETGRDCACGKEFKDGSYMTLEGSQYIVECECWHLRAAQVMRFIDGHAHKIAKYLNGEKKRKTAEAGLMPDVNP